MSDFWNPAPGDSVAGELVELDTFTGKFGTCPVLSLRNTEGQVVKVRADAKVLLEELAKRSPIVGEHVHITYIGRAGEGDGAYHSYSVVGGELAFSWADFGGRDRQPAASPIGPSNPTSATPQADGQDDSGPALISDEQKAAIDDRLAQLKPAIAADLKTAMRTSYGADWRGAITATLADKTIARLDTLTSDPTNLASHRPPRPADTAAPPAPEEIPF